MRKNPYPGKFIVFEGLDGSGQSSQTKLLADFLRERGQDVLTTKEPTKESGVADALRKVLDKKEKMGPKALQELFAKDRKWHLEEKVIPALKDNKTVISDRYFFSSFAYGLTDGLTFEEIHRLNQGFLLPDIVFFLDVDAQTCFKRIAKRGEQMTVFERQEKLEKVYRNYQEVLKNFEDKTSIYFINGQKSIEQVFEEIKKYV